MVYIIIVCIVNTFNSVTVYVMHAVILNIIDIDLVIVNNIAVIIDINSMLMVDDIIQKFPKIMAMFFNSIIVTVLVVTILFIARIPESKRHQEPRFRCSMIEQARFWRT